MLPPPPSPSGTVYETDEEIMQALRAGGTGTSPPVRPPSSPPAPRAAAGPATPASVVTPYRPTHRPPIAFLTVFDDGRTDGEVVRVRADRFVIGRAEGDLLIPHDALVSTRHAEITRQLVDGRYRWVVTDLLSTNGLFVRASKSPLGDGAEFLVGGGRYRVEAETPASTPTLDHAPPAGHPAATRPWAEEVATVGRVALTELVDGGLGNRYVLTKPEYWIGSDPGCAVCRPNDPFVDPRHLRLHRDVRGVWHAEHNGTASGFWVRMPQITVDTGCQFQIGEQRFRLQVRPAT